jgi:hypothetical protein
VVHYLWILDSPAGEKCFNERLKHFPGCRESQGAETKTMDGIDKVFEAIANNIIVFGAFLVPIGIVAVTSYFSHKRLEMMHQERMAAIQKGLLPPGELPDPDKEERERKAEEEGRKSPPDYLQTGLFWLCPGAGLVIFSLVFLADMPAGVRLPILGVSMAAAGVGAAYLAIYFFEQERRRSGIQ